MITITIESANAEAMLRKIAQKSHDTRPAMVEIAEMMLFSVEENFEQEGRPKWEDLKESTKRARARRGTWPGKILQESRQLLGSLTRRATATEAIVGSNKEYAATQFLGDPSRNIPARNALVAQPEDVAEAETILLRHLLR